MWRDILPSFSPALVCLAWHGGCRGLAWPGPAQCGLLVPAWQRRVAQTEAIHSFIHFARRSRILPPPSKSVRGQKAGLPGTQAHAPAGSPGVRQAGRQAGGRAPPIRTTRPPARPPAPLPFSSFHIPIPPTISHFGRTSLHAFTISSGPSRNSAVHAHTHIHTSPLSSPFHLVVITTTTTTTTSSTVALATAILLRRLHLPQHVSTLTHRRPYFYRRSPSSKRAKDGNSPHVCAPPPPPLPPPLLPLLLHFTPQSNTSFAHPHLLTPETHVAIVFIFPKTTSHARESSGQLHSCLVPISPGIHPLRG